MRVKNKSLAAGVVLLTVMVGICAGILLRGVRPASAASKDVYASFLGKDTGNYSLDGRLDIRLGMISDGTGIGSAIPVTVSVGFSDQVVDHSAKGKTSMRLSVLDLSDGYEIENYAAYDSEGNAFSTYARARTGDGGDWGGWSVQDGYMLTLDSRALFRTAYLLEDRVTAVDGTYMLQVRPDGVWDALGLDELVKNVTGAEEFDRTAYQAAVSKSTACYEVSAETGYLTAVDADGFSMTVDGNSVKASFRVEFSGYGGGDQSDVAVPETVLASAVYGEMPGLSLLGVPGGKTESVVGTAVEDVDQDSWVDQFSGDYGFDVVKYDDGTWHVLDMDGNEIEGAEVYDDGSVYHPEYGRIYPDYETDNG